LKKIVSGSSDFSNMKEYTKSLIKRFDGNQDGFISMSELSEGLRRMGISLNSREVAALMEKLDLDKNGEITQEELYKVLIGYEAYALPKLNAAQVSVDQAIKKLASGAETFSNMKEYVRFLIK
jgi:EF-hand domain pair